MDDIRRFCLRTCREGNCKKKAYFRGYCGLHFCLRRENGTLPSKRNAGMIFGHSAAQWSETDTDYLLNNYGVFSVKRIAKHLGRTECAVDRRCRKLGISIFSQDGRYSASELAKCFGIWSNQVTDWIDNGLRAIRRPMDGIENERAYAIDVSDLRKFFKAHPEAFDCTTLGSTIRAKLNLKDMELPPIGKVVECSACEQRHNLALYTINNHCSNCGRTLKRWAVSYTDKIDKKPVKRDKYDVSYYDSERDLVQCLDCKRWFRSLISHIVKVHGYVDGEAYRSFHKQPLDSTLICKSTRDKCVKNWGRNVYSDTAK